MSGCGTTGNHDEGAQDERCASAYSRISTIFGLLAVVSFFASNMFFGSVLGLDESSVALARKIVFGGSTLMFLWFKLLADYPAAKRKNAPGSVERQ